MYKVILILDKFFLKYERRGQINLPPWKTTLKKPSLIRVFPPWLLYIYISLYISLYVYIERYIEIYRYIVITVEKTIYLNEKYFRLTLLSILYQYIYIYIYILFYLNVIYKFMEWPLHLESTFPTRSLYWMRQSHFFKFSQRKKHDSWKSSQL